MATDEEGDAPKSPPTKLDDSVIKRVTADLAKSPKHIKNSAFDTTISPVNTGDSLEKTPTPPKNYKLLYKEVKKRLFEQAESGRTRFLDLQKAYNELKKRSGEEISIKENIINEKDKQISKLKEEIDKIGSKSNATGLRRVKSNESVFRLKPKKGSKQTDPLKCEFEGCSEKSVDLIKCNMCETWVCENCNDVPVAKMKPIMNKCSTIYFLCKTCDSKVGTQPGSNDQITEGNQTIDLQNMINKGFARVEAMIETTITQKLEEKISNLTPAVEKDNEFPALTREYAKKVMEVPKEIRKIMKEERNGEKVEQNERERRAANFIIHGAIEIGETAEDVEVNDKDYIDELLKHLKVRSKPFSITRLGAPNENKTRVMKITMSNEDDKQKVMANLRMLKGMEEEFGKISVTDDYTSTDREMIKAKVEEAKELGKKNPKRIYKVRGDPKNGLRIMSFAKKP